MPKNTPAHRSQPRPVAPRKGRLKRRAAGLALILVVVFVAHTFVGRAFNNKLQPVAIKEPAQSVAAQAQAQAVLDTQINSILEANTTIYISVTTVNINSGVTKNYGPEVPYEAASIAKLITASDFYDQVIIGKEKLTNILEDGNTAQQDLQKMIVNSDNNAWVSLNDELTDTQLSYYAKSIGITDYDVSANTLTTSDIGMLLQKLYKDQLLNKKYTDQLLSYMKVANENTLIPPVVPSDATVYHKAGLLDDRVHDAAIVDNGQTPIVLVVFTNGHGTYDFPARTQIIQSIAKDTLTGFGIH